MSKNKRRWVTFKVTQKEYDKLRELSEKLDIGRGGVSLVAKYATRKALREKINEGVINDF